jgi:hypothetical protein
MPPLLATSSEDSSAIVLATCVLIAAVCVVMLMVISKLRELIAPKSIYGRVRRFLGPQRLKKFQFHEKTFPGYDLASTNFAIDSFLSELCQSQTAVGSVPIQLNLQSMLHSARAKKSTLKFLPPTFTRLPIDVAAERSFPSNMLWLAIAKPEAFNDANGSPEPEGQRLVILLRAKAGAYLDADEDLNLARTPSQILELIVMCSSRGIADQYFAAIESRRKKLSVFRGKVVDPILAPGGIHTIAFRQIQPVAEDDLILPDSVKSLIRGSIVDFYNHRETLQALGVELKRGILFYSPPGTGKTSICLHLAGLLPNFTICFVAGRKLLHPRELCSMARYLQPTMLVFEDIDLIAHEREHNGLATVLGELMNQIDGCEPNDQVLFVMNTNSLDRMEAAVRNRPGRVDQIIHIPLPDRELRIALIKRFSRKLQLDESAVASLADASHGATPAIIKEVVKRSAVLALARGGTARRDGHPNQITVRESDLLLALEQVMAVRSDAKAIGNRPLEDVL